MCDRVRPCVTVMVLGLCAGRTAAAAAQAVTFREEEGLAVWEAQAMLPLWLSILILIPFELATVDTEAAIKGDTGRCVGARLCQKTGDSAQPVLDRTHSHLHTLQGPTLHNPRRQDLRTVQGVPPAPRCNKWVQWSPFLTFAVKVLVGWRDG